MDDRRPSASDCHSPGIPKGGLHGKRPNSGTSVHAIAACIYRVDKRIVTPDGPGAFNVNPCLIAGDDPLLFHAGHRRVLPRMSEAVAKVLPMDRFRYVAFSHIEADECGSLNDFLAAALKAMAVCSRVAALVFIDDVTDRPARPLADGETHGSAWRGDGAALLRALARSLIGRGRTM